MEVQNADMIDDEEDKSQDTEDEEVSEQDGEEDTQYSSKPA